MLKCITDMDDVRKITRDVRWIRISATRYKNGEEECDIPLDLLNRYVEQSVLNCA